MPMTLTRSILSIFVPGGIALAPWLLYIAVRFPSAAAFYDNYSTPANFVIIAAIIVTGTIFETWGATLEKRWDTKREEKYEVLDNWYAYLARSIDPEPVGYRYISRTVTTMYFELTMIFASFSLIIGGAAVVSSQWPKLAAYITLTSIVLGAASARYFRFQAYRSHRLLCKTRREINQRLADASA